MNVYYLQYKTLKIECHVTSLCLQSLVDVDPAIQVMLPGICGRFVRLQAVKSSSSSSSSRSRRAVTSDAAGPTVSISSGSISLVTPND